LKLLEEENRSLKRNSERLADRNFELEAQSDELKAILDSVVAKFKSERSALKQRVLKLERKLGQREMSELVATKDGMPTAVVFISQENLCADEFITDSSKKGEAQESPTKKGQESNILSDMTNLQSRFISQRADQSKSRKVFEESKEVGQSQEMQVKSGSEKFWCRACSRGFLSKKHYDKHRKS